MKKDCFLFGHGDAPDGIQPAIEEAVERHYEQYGARRFFVGSYGAFDAMAVRALRQVKLHHGDLELNMILAYHPAERQARIPEGFDHTFYPPLEGVPRRYAIVRANRYMIEKSDTIICYVNHFGNARNLLDYAERRRKKSEIILDNIAAAISGVQQRNV